MPARVAASSGRAGRRWSQAIAASTASSSADRNATTAFRSGRGAYGAVGVEAGSTIRSPESAVAAVTASSLWRSRIVRSVEAGAPRARRRSISCARRSRARIAKRPSARSRAATNVSATAFATSLVRAGSSPVATTSSMLTAASNRAETLVSSDPADSPGSRRAASAKDGRRRDKLGAGREPPVGRLEVDGQAGAGIAGDPCGGSVAVRRQQRDGDREHGDEGDEGRHEAPAPPDRAGHAAQVDRRIAVGVNQGVVRRHVIAGDANQEALVPCWPPCGVTRLPLHSGVVV